MKLIKYLSLLLILFSSINAKAESRKNQLDRLFNELKTDNPALTYETEQKIWKIWSTHPTNQNLTEKLTEGSKLVRNKKLLKAIKIFTEVINKDPEWAEAWNKRATVLYMMSDYKGSQNDIEKVLKLEKRHFGALAGQGLVNVKLENYEKAIKSYKRAKEIYPTMQSPDIMIKQIEKLIKQQLI
jgi:tetratricopeptide (TPR) repeat protein